MKITEAAMDAIANAMKQPKHGSIKSMETLPDGPAKIVLNMAFVSEEIRSFDNRFPGLLNNLMNDADELYKEENNE